MASIYDLPNNYNRATMGYQSPDIVEQNRWRDLLSQLRASPDPTSREDLLGRMSAFGEMMKTPAYQQQQYGTQSKIHNRYAKDIQWGINQGFLDPSITDKGPTWRRVAPVLGMLAAPVLGMTGALGGGAGASGAAAGTSGGLGGGSGTVGSIFGSPAITGGGLGGTAGGLGGASAGFGGLSSLGSAGFVPSSATLGASMAQTPIGSALSQSASGVGGGMSFAPQAGLGALGAPAVGAGAGLGGLSQTGSESPFPGATLSPQAAIETPTPGLGLAEGTGSGLGLSSAGGVGLNAQSTGLGLSAPAFGGGTISGAAAAGGGGLLAGLGSLTDVIKNYGPVIYAGMEYKNAADAAQAYQDQLQRAIESSDPFSPERAMYQKMLEEHLRNPESFLNSPQVKFASEAAARQMASMGYNLSPRQAEAVSEASIGKYYDQAKLLAGLAGAEIPPQVGGMNQAAQFAAQAKLNKDASLGNITRTAIDTFFGDNQSQGVRLIGDRGFLQGSLV